MKLFHQEVPQARLNEGEGSGGDREAEKKEARKRADARYNKAINGDSGTAADISNATEKLKSSLEDLVPADLHEEKAAPEAVEKNDETTDASQKHVESAAAEVTEELPESPLVAKVMQENAWLYGEQKEAQKEEEPAVTAENIPVDEAAAAASEAAKDLESALSDVDVDVDAPVQKEVPVPAPAQVETQSADTVVSEEVSTAEVDALDPELAQRLQKMKTQMTRLVAKTRKRAQKAGISVAQAKESSENFDHARGVIDKIRYRIGAIEKGAEVAVKEEEISQLESELAQALWDMRSELSPAAETMPEEAEQVAKTEAMDTAAEEGELTAAAVYQTLRDETASMEAQMNDLFAAHPELKENPRYDVYARQIDKLKTQIADDETAKSHYGIARATLSSLERQFHDFEHVALGTEKLAQTQEDPVEDQAALAANKELADDAPDGLFAYGEEKSMVEKKQQFIDQVHDKVSAFLEENPDLENTPEYEVLQSTLATMEAAQPHTKEHTDDVTDALLAIQAVEVAHKAALAKKEKEPMEPLVLTPDMRVVDEVDEVDETVLNEVQAVTGDPAADTFIFNDDVVQESSGEGEIETEATTESAEEVPRLFGSEIPKAGADGRFAARSFKEGLLLVRGKIEDPETQAKVDDVLRVVGYIPDSGLREEDVAQLARLAREIGQPDSLLNRRFDRVEDMYADVEAKVNEKLSALKQKKGGQKSKRLMGLSTLLRRFTSSETNT